MIAIEPALPEARRPRLKAMLAGGRVLRAIECHDALSAVLAERCSHVSEAGTTTFDMLWLSGFSHATMLALPDAEWSILEHRLASTADIAARTHLPMLADADTGGDACAFVLLCRRLEALGVSGVVVEDKSGAKRSSLADDVHHELLAPEVFVQKIAAAKAKQLSTDFLIFARTESLIAGLGVDEALRRASVYLRSQADGLVVHSKDSSAQEVFAFLEGYQAMQRETGIRKPLICIPTAYSHVTATELHARGASIVIFGNHMIRAAYKAMQQVAETILRNDRAQEADSLCASVREIFATIGDGEVVA